MAKNVSSIVSGMGVAVAIVDGLMKAAKRAGLLDEAIHNLARPENPENEGLFDKFVELLAQKVSNLLEFLNTVTIPAATDQLVAKEKLVIGQNGIGYWGDNFKKWFGGKVEESQAEVTLRRYQLKKWSRDLPIINELGGEEEAETTLSAIHSLISRQTKGEAGTLLTNGYASIFYVRDIDGVLRAVSVYWCGGGWDLNADALGNPSGWRGGIQVFSRN